MGRFARAVKQDLRPVARRPPRRIAGEGAPFHRIGYEDIFSQDEFEAIKRGLVAHRMEDRWFMFYEEDTLYVCRTWTSALLFKVHFERRRNGSVAATSEELGRLGSDPWRGYENSARLLRWLVRGLLLQQEVAFPVIHEAGGASSVVNVRCPTGETLQAVFLALHDALEKKGFRVEDGGQLRLPVVLAETARRRVPYLEASEDPLRALLIALKDEMRVKVTCWVVHAPQAGDIAGQRRELRRKRQLKETLGEVVSRVMT